MIVLSNTLVYDWEMVHLPALFSGIFIFVFGEKLYRSCHICDKDVLKVSSQQLAVD